MKSTRFTEEAQQVTIEEPGLLEKLESFAQTNIRLIQYKAIDKGTEIASSVVSILIMSVFFILGFIILSIALALLIGSWLNSSYWGFFIIAAVYFIIGLIAFLLRDKWIKTPLINTLSKKFIN